MEFARLAAFRPVRGRNSRPFPAPGRGNGRIAVGSAWGSSLDEGSAVRIDPGGTPGMILIRGAEVYDPAHNINGQIQDLWVEGERIAPAPLEFGTPEVIDASGAILAPAGVEIHTHVAGGGLNDARRFLLGNRELLDLLAPSAETAARRYLSLGYTTVFDAAS